MSKLLAFSNTHVKFRYETALEGARAAVGGGGEADKDTLEGVGTD